MSLDYCEGTEKVPLEFTVSMGTTDSRSHTRFLYPSSLGFPFHSFTYLKHLIQSTITM